MIFVSFFLYTQCNALGCSFGENLTNKEIKHNYFIREKSFADYRHKRDKFGFLIYVRLFCFL